MILAKTVTNAYHVRYVLAPVIGFSVLLCLGVFRMGRGQPLVAVTLSLILGGWTAARGLGTVRKLDVRAQELAACFDFINANAGEPLPIAIANGVPYHHLAYYGPRTLTKRFVYLADPASEIKYLRHDTIDRSLLAIGRWAGLDVRDYAIYVAEGTPFYVYDFAVDWSWLTTRLAAEGFTVRLVARKDWDTLYRVEPHALREK